MSDFENILDIQRNMASRISREQTMDRTIEMMTIIQGLIPDKHGRIAKETIFFEAVQNGMLQAESEVLLRELIRNGTLREEDSYVLF